MELLDIVDKNGEPTGQVIDREEAHRTGALHRTSHVWIVREKEGKIQVLLQKRSEEKDSFPGCYDISSAGHIPAGVDFIPSALRELKEELGYEAQAEDLIYCGYHLFESKHIFHDQLFHNYQYSRIYMLYVDQDVSKFTIQKEELSEICWMNLDECIKGVEKNSFPHCIHLDELELIRDKYQQGCVDENK